MGIIKPAHSQWAYPDFLVPKKGTDLQQIVLDYRVVSTILKPITYPLPTIANQLASLEDSAGFSSIDLLKGHNQLPLDPSTSDITTMTTTFGTF